MVHYKKIAPPYFLAVKLGVKPFEVRLNDCNYQEGDTIVLREYADGAYTGQEIVREITYVLDSPAYCKEGYVVLGIGMPSSDIDGYIRLSDAKAKIMEYIGEQTVSKYGTADECRSARSGAEGAMNELDDLPRISASDMFGCPVHKGDKIYMLKTNPNGCRACRHGSLPSTSLCRYECPSDQFVIPTATVNDVSKVCCLQADGSIVLKDGYFKTQEEALNAKIEKIRERKENKLFFDSMG